MVNLRIWPDPPHVHDASDPTAPKAVQTPPQFNPSGVHDASEPDPSKATTYEAPKTPTKPATR